MTMYNKERFLVDSVISRYAIGNRTQGLKIALDGLTRMFETEVKMVVISLFEVSMKACYTHSRWKVNHLVVLDCCCHPCKYTNQNK